MRILGISDVEEDWLTTYYDHERMRDVDLIISCGDLPARYLEHIVTLANVPLLYVPGNHDTDYARHQPEGCISIEGGIRSFRGLHIMGLGGSLKYNGTVYGFSEQEMRWRAAKMSLLAQSTGGVDILVTHAPIRGFGDLDDLPHRGFEAFDTLVERLRPRGVRGSRQTRSVCPEGARSREAAPSQLGAATLGTDAYSYSYDNIGNRKTAQEAAEEATAYDANNLNQYTAIQEGTAEAFVPTFDADGNQTKVKTSTGIWNVVYNAENRPVTFTSADGATIVECTYDYMGRRHTRKITVNGSVTNYLRYIYRGYLQIAAINAVSGVFQWFILWDPTQPVATRPLGIRKDGTWYTYGWDLTKNICEVFVSGGTIGAAYAYTPYGAVTATGNATQHVQLSSEYNDTVLGLVYYNYRHYNPSEGRWTGRDPLPQNTQRALYHYGNAVSTIDVLGLTDPLSYLLLTAGYGDGGYVDPATYKSTPGGNSDLFYGTPRQDTPAYPLTEPKLPNKEPELGFSYSGNSKDFLRCGKYSAKIGWPNSFATGSVVFDATAMNPSESHVVGAFVDKPVLGVGLSATYGLPSETATFALDIGKSTFTFTDSEIKFGYTPLKGVNMEAAFDKTSNQFNKASVMGGFQISEDLKANFGVNYTANSPNPLTILGGLSYKHSGNGSDWTMDFSISANQQEIVVGAGFSYSW